MGAFLAGYAERDYAIERLVDDIAVNRLRMIDELRQRLLPHTRAVFVARVAASFAWACRW